MPLIGSARPCGCGQRGCAEVTTLGDRLSSPLLERIDTAAANSPLLASYGAAERLQLADPETEYGVLGASWMARIP